MCWGGDGAACDSRGPCISSARGGRAVRNLEGSTLNSASLRFSVGFVVVALVAVAVSLYLSSRYLEDEERLASTGDTEGALQSAEMASRLDPFSAEPLLAEASLLQTEGDYAEAGDVLRSAAEREPADYSIPQQLGNLQMGTLNRPGEAAESYRRALELSPETDTLRSDLAEAHLSAGELQKAKIQYEKLQESGELSVEQLYDLGRIQVRTGEAGEGVQTLRRAERRAEDGLRGLSGASRQQQLGFISSVELAIADALVVERRYAEARRIVASSPAEQAPTILSLINSGPEGYRQAILESDVY